MIRQIDLEPDATPQACAEAVQSSWPTAAVLHLKGVKPDGDLRAFYEEFFSHVGKAIPLAEDASMTNDRNKQRTGGIWFEVRYDPDIPDAYRHSSNAQPLHTDGSYIPSFPNAGILACQAMPEAGGATTFVDGSDIVEALRNERPDLLRRLEATDLPHARSGDRRVEPVIRYERGEPLLNWNYYCVDPACSQDLHALKQEFFDFLAASETIRERTRSVLLRPGEAVLWKDDRILHGRQAFNAHAPADAVRHR